MKGELDAQKPKAYVLRGEVEGVRMAESGNEEVRGQSDCSLQLLKGNYKDNGAKHTFVRPDDTPRSCGQLGRFSSDITKNFLTSSRAGKGQQVSIFGGFQSLARESHSRLDISHSPTQGRSLDPPSRPFPPAPPGLWDLVILNQGQVGRGSEQPDLMVDVPDHCKGVVLDGL